MFIDKDTLTKLLDWDGLIASLNDIFVSGCEMPLRHHHTLSMDDEADATLLLMPAWTHNGYLGVKMVTVFPGNGARGMASINSLYTLSSAKTGELLATMDGGELTARRTAAASALASRYLSRKDASTMLMVGTGRLAMNLIQAHASQRPLKTVNLWGRNTVTLNALANDVSQLGFQVNLFEGDGLESAVRQSDIVSCATLSKAPLVQGAWLQPGSHLDLVGGFTPEMREADDAAIRTATVFVDTRTGCTHEAGDIVIPLSTGVLTEQGIAADLYDLCALKHTGRTDNGEVTLFKSVGAASEDLAGAMYAYSQVMLHQKG